MTCSQKSTPATVRAIDGTECDIPFVAWWSYDPASPYELSVSLQARTVRLARDQLLDGLYDEQRASEVTIKPRAGEVLLRVADAHGAVLYAFPRDDMRSLARMVCQLSPPPDDDADWDAALRREVMAP